MGPQDSTEKPAMGIAFLGCGYVADLYLRTLGNRAGSLALWGVWDKDDVRLKRSTEHYDVPAYTNLGALLADLTIDIVVSLTNPNQHYEVSPRILAPGKHVYSETPLALNLDAAEDLISQAADVGLQIVAAPSTVLGSATQTMLKRVQDGVRGRPHLIYAELNDGMVPKIGCERCVTGTVWPAADEFATDCTIEHAGYALSRLVTVCSPVRRVVTFAGLTVPDNGPATPKELTTLDMADAIREGRAPPLAGKFFLHITKVSSAIQHPERFGTNYVPRSAPGPVAPLLVAS